MDLDAVWVSQFESSGTRFPVRRACYWGSVLVVRASGSGVVLLGLEEYSRSGAGGLESWDRGDEVG